MDVSGPEYAVEIEVCCCPVKASIIHSAVHLRMNKFRRLPFRNQMLDRPPQYFVSFQCASCIKLFVPNQIKRTV